MRSQKMIDEISPFVKAMNERGCDVSEIVESVLLMGYPAIAEGSTVYEIVFGIMEPQIEEESNDDDEMINSYYKEYAKLPRVQKLLVDNLFEGFITTEMSRNEIITRDHTEPNSKNYFSDDDLKKAVEFFKKYEAIN